MPRLEDLYAYSASDETTKYVCSEQTYHRDKDMSRQGGTYCTLRPRTLILMSSGGACCIKLSDLDCSASFFKGLLGFCGLFFGDTFLDIRRRSFDHVFGFLQA